ncbi:hypothetical protein BDN72DRAFT_905189 [Pluteus cervinus]|uniref:Uncharacterized protein n=1 Tax=Pluteus cervinus TaxID=181527 RepID=A0ACD3A2V5_9AGAR|nr:hypothetical protein BDN72DRAFT_905189 [Pluteus cervinus]
MDFHDGTSLNVFCPAIRNYNTIHHHNHPRPSTQPPVAIHGDPPVIVGSAAWNAEEHTDASHCYLNTRQDIFDSLDVWPNTRGDPVRWISGWPGTGKTAIARTMARYWAGQGLLVASFFFSRSSSDRSTTSHCLDTMIQQFAMLGRPSPDGGPSAISHKRWDDWIIKLSRSSQPKVVVIDGLDECNDEEEQKQFLRDVLGAFHQPQCSVKLLISCQPERHLEDIFDEFRPFLGGSYRISLGQSDRDNAGIRTLFRIKLDEICHHRRKDKAMSIKDKPWPLDEDIEVLVKRASGQFAFAVTAIAFIDNEDEDPVKQLQLILEYQADSFAAVDTRYLVILNRVAPADSPYRQLTHHLLFHINHEPSSSFDIGEFWFVGETAIDIRIKRLRSVLVRRESHGPGSQELIHFRHKSFHDFFARPSSPHDFSLAAVDPVSKFFFFLRRSARTAHLGMNLQRFKVKCRSQWLCYSFLYWDDRPPTILPYEEEAQRLHHKYAADVVGCKCVSWPDDKTDFSAAYINSLKSCGQSDCIVDADLLALCQMIGRAAKRQPDHFIAQWEEWEKTQPNFVKLLKLLLFLRIVLLGLFNPLQALGTIVLEDVRRGAGVLRNGFSSSALSPFIAAVNAFLCVMVFVNTRDLWLLIPAFYVAVNGLLGLLLYFSLHRTTP